MPFHARNRSKGGGVLIPNHVVGVVCSIFVASEKIISMLIFTSFSGIEFYVSVIINIEPGPSHNSLVFVPIMTDLSFK